jgi:hypothetical protein
MASLFGALEVALLLVRFDLVASFIVDANRGMM